MGTLTGLRPPYGIVGKWGLSLFSHGDGVGFSHGLPRAGFEPMTFALRGRRPIRAELRASRVGKDPHFGPVAAHIPHCVW